MVSKKITLTNAQGFHMRPAMNFVNAITKFPCKITIKTGDREIDGKSVMNLISACIKCGMEIEIICEGEQENEAIETAIALIESGFGE